MANKNFEVKHGLSIGGTERITSAGAGTLTDLTLSGNLTVNGTTVTLDAATLQVEDKNITLNYHASNDTSSSADGAGITIQDAVNSSTDATLNWSASNDRFVMSHGLEVTSGNVGIGNASPTSNLTIGSSQSDGLEFTYDSTNNYRNQILNYWNSNSDTRMDFNLARTSGGTPATVMSVGYDSNVGIGTTSPTRKLSISGTGAEYINIVGGTSSGVGLLLGDSNAEINAAIICDNSNDSLNFRAGGNSTKMILNSSGNVLLGGNTDRSRKLVLEGTGDLLMLYSTNSGAGGAQLDLKHASPSYADGDKVGRVLFSNSDRQLASIETEGVSSGERGVLALGVRKSASAYNYDAFRLHNSGDEIYADIYSPSGGNRGAGYFRFKTDGGSTEESVAQIYMEQGSGDGGSRKCNMYFQVSDNGSPATALTIENNKVAKFASANVYINNSTTYAISSSTAGTVIRGATVKCLRSHDHRTPTYSSNAPAHLAFGFTSYALNNTSPWADILYLNSYSDGSGGSPNALVISKSGSNAKIVRHSFSTSSSTAISNGTSYGLDSASASDSRLKENVNDITNGLNIIKALRPVTYNWNDTYLSAGMSKNAEELTVEADDTPVINIPKNKVENVGLIAQEVESVLPTVVHENTISIDGVNYKTVKYEKIVPHLIASIKEQQTIIDDLKSRIETLEG